MTTELSNLNTAIATLTTAVDAAVAAGIGTGVAPADVQAAADKVNAQAARLAIAPPAP